MDRIESLTLYFGDSGEWSDNALRDGAWYIHHAGVRRPGYSQKGKWTRAKMSVASRNVDLGDPIGRRRFILVTLPEPEEIGRRLADCDVFIYSYLSGFRTVAAAMLIAVLRLAERVGVRLVRDIFRGLQWHR